MGLKRIVKRILGIKEKELTCYDISKLVIQKIRDNGGKVGENVDIIDSIIDVAKNRIEIGDNVTLTGIRLLTHDASAYRETGIMKRGKVKIGSNDFVGVGSIILCGRTIGNNVVVGAGTVVSKDIPDNVVVAGNPMKIICSYDEYMEKVKKQYQEGKYIIE